MHSDQCRCLPGTEEDGWHEIRCAYCAEQDHQVWVRLMEFIASPKFDELVERTRRDAIER